MAARKKTRDLSVATMRKLFTMEELFTSDDYFGVSTATPLQRAICRIVDGLPLGDLAKHPHVLEAIGDVGALEPGHRPKEVCIYSGIRTGKSLFTACCAVRAALTVDLGHLRPGEEARISVLATDTDKARVVHMHIIAAIQEKPTLKALLTLPPRAKRLRNEDDLPGVTKDSIWLEHPSGRKIEITTVAGARAGASLVGRWCAGVIFDEQPRMVGSDDGAVINFDDAAASVRRRLLDGAQMLCVGSPFAPTGPAWKAVQEHWKRPKRDMVVIKARGDWLNPSWWTPEKQEETRLASIKEYKTEFLGEFADGDAAALDPELVGLTARPIGRAIPYGSCKPVGFLDSSQGRGDAWSYAIGQWVYGTSRGPEQVGFTDEGNPIYVEHPDVDPVQNKPVPTLHMTDVNSVEGKFRQTLTSDQIIEHISSLMKQNGVTDVYGDQHQAYVLESSFQRHGVRYHTMNWTNRSKSDAVSSIRRWLTDKTILIDGPKGAACRQELIELREKPLPSGGYVYEAPRGKHDDLAALLVTAGILQASGEWHGAPLALRSDVVRRGANEFESTLI